MTYSCQCPCGTSRFEINGEPIARFFCHCTICQAQYQAPYVDINLYKLNEVEIPHGLSLDFKQLKRFMAVDRGFCPSCQKPVMAKVGEGGKGFGFVAVRNYSDPSNLPPPEMHVYYGTRVADVDDDLPKYANFLTSNYALIKRMTRASGNKA
ncbi:MAG: GFA family protein [Pseudomonadota bacterium]